MKRALTICLLMACGSLAGCVSAIMGNGGDTRTSAQVSADASITADVKARLLTNAELKPLSINVLTQDGAVTLNGKVNSKAQRETAGRLARGVKGVKSVRNELSFN
jgi:hyperosmotically inducible periplasmic protein